jgi:Fe2+ transport system protein FeoA
MISANLTDPIAALNATACCLADLKHGQIAVVIAVHEVKLAARLAARGLVPGAELEVLRGGDPLLVRMDNSRWAVSGLEAALVEVECTAGRSISIPAFLRKLFA